MTIVRYQALPGDVSWLPNIKLLIESFGVRRVADLGAGANPILTPEYVAGNGLEYTIFDISADELAQADEGYRKVVADVAADGFAQGRSFDLVLTRWVLEHLTRPAQFHRNVFSMLPPGGHAVHFFPTLYSPPFVVNRVLPESLSDRLLRATADRGSKFPARYRWCRGPTRRQIERLRSTGFEVESYEGYYGHPYFRSLAWLDRAERLAATWLARYPVPHLTSFASMTLRKPVASRSWENFE